MEIKTKFNNGDKVWTLHKSRAMEIVVAAIIVDSTNCVYLRNEKDFMSYRESECFATKEELLNYVAGE